MVASSTTVPADLVTLAIYASSDTREMRFVRVMMSWIRSPVLYLISELQEELDDTLDDEWLDELSDDSLLAELGEDDDWELLLDSLLSLDRLDGLLEDSELADELLDSEDVELDSELSDESDDEDDSLDRLLTELGEEEVEDEDELDELLDSEEELDDSSSASVKNTVIRP